MAYVDVSGSNGGRLEVDPLLFQRNSQIDILTGYNPYLGSKTVVDGLIQSNGSANNVRRDVSTVIGRWFKVTDSTVKMKKTSSSKWEAIWNTSIGPLPMGDDTDIKYEPSTFDLVNPFADEVDVFNVYIRCSQKTAPYLRVEGFINEPEYQHVVSRRSAEKKEVTTKEVVSKGFSTIMIVAIIGAAIWFLPRGIVRGAA